MCNRLLRAGALLVAACVLLVGAAAANTIDFASTASGGTISFLPAFGNDLSVTNANIGQLQLSNVANYAVVGGLLNVLTGGCTVYCTTNTVGSFVNSTDDFADGGFLTITGSVPSLPGDPSGVLVSGVWDHNEGSTVFGEPSPCPAHASLHTDPTQISTFGGCLRVTSINTLMLADLGFPTSFTSGFGFLSEMEFNLSYSGLTGFSGTVESSDLGVDPQVPEPATLALLGAGLLGLGSLTRRKLFRK